ncbi:hypothetical protein HZA96_06640 [Candidatus Woesearchaeota archaeon]|nr:hypothetical protein [Candidatus Woesearchaeota archaeon]
MVSITLSMDDSLRNELKRFSWVNWSEIAKEEAQKKLIFESYIKIGKITEEEWAFCEEIDWHPVDELPLKEEFKKEIEKRKKAKFLRIKSLNQLFE